MNLEKLTNKYLLNKIIHSDWVEMVEEVNANPTAISMLYTSLKKRLRTRILNEQTLNMACCFLENNNILFHKNASYKQYQIISSECFARLLDLKNIENLALFYRFCLVGVYTDYFKVHQENEKPYKHFLIEGLEYFKYRFNKQPTKKTVGNYILALIHLSQYYLFKGELDKNHLYLQNTLVLIKQHRNLNVNYKLFFYYHYAWSFYEKRSYNKALENINKLLSLKGKIASQPIILHGMNIKCAILFSLKQYSSCLTLAKQTANESGQVFSLKNQDVYAESLLNIAKCLTKKNNELAVAISSARTAVKILTKLFLGPDVDPSQALANIVLAEACERAENKKLALKYFETAKVIYEKIYRFKAKKQKGYLELLTKIKK